MTRYHKSFTWLLLLLLLFLLLLLLWLLLLLLLLLLLSLLLLLLLWLLWLLLLWLKREEWKELRKLDAHERHLIPQHQDLPAKWANLGYAVDDGLKDGGRSGNAQQSLDCRLKLWVVELV